MRLRVFLQNPSQDQRHRARLACAGGAEHGEVLAQQVVNLDHRRDARILLYVPDADRGVLIGGIGHRQFGLGRARHDVAETRIAGYAAPEALRVAIVVLRQFANELHFDDAHFLRLVVMGRSRAAQRRNQRQRHRLFSVDLQQRADFRRTFRAGRERIVGIEKNDRVCTCNRDDAADALVRGVHLARGAGCILTGTAHLGVTLGGRMRHRIRRCLRGYCSWPCRRRLIQFRLANGRCRES